MANLELSEQELIRRQSLDKLRELGIEPYPAALYPVNATAKVIEAEYDPEKAISRTYALQVGSCPGESWERRLSWSFRIPREGYRFT